MKIVLGGDHAGFPLKVKVAHQLEAWGHEVHDVGTHDTAPVDFPDVTAALVAKLRDGTAERGLLVCGTGVGASIAANKFRGIRAALCHDVHSAHQCVEHDDANVMCIGGWIVGEKLAYDLISAFLGATFSTDEAFRRRVAKLGEIERREGGG